MQVPEGERRHYAREYPFAWFGVLAEAPPSAPELFYRIWAEFQARVAGQDGFGLEEGREVRNNEPDALDQYGSRAIGRVWKAQHFSYWMTTMLHLLPHATPFDTRRQIGELESVVSSAAGSAYLAGGYTGWPGQR
jgi:hypothetical protein